MDGITVDIQDVFSFAGGWQVLGIVLAALAAAGYIAAVVFCQVTDIKNRAPCINR